MTTITVFGGTGYAGGHIVREAASRGHRVIVVSRSAQASGDTAENVEYRALDVREDEGLAAAIADSDVVVSALSPRGGLDGDLPEVDRKIADLVAAGEGSLYVVGGFSSLRTAADAPRVIEQGFGPVEGVPAEQIAAMTREATQMNSILLDLLAREDDLAWTFISPGMAFGAHVPGERTGSYRVSTDGLVLLDADGNSGIGGADFAVALLDQVESESPHRGHIAIAY